MCAAASLAASQELRVYSEFQRIDPFGNVVAPDLASQERRPREILSPAIARNAFASFHLVVTAPRELPYILHVGQNPEDAVGIALYREVHTKQGQAWIPDRLQRVKLPYEGRIEAIPQNRTSDVFWLDLRVAQESRVRRVKVEPQLWANDRWTVYPMEVRIVWATAPKPAAARGALHAATSPADASVFGPLMAHFCGSRQTARGLPLTIRHMIRRNAEQDVALAASYEKKHAPEVIAKLLEASGARVREEWCAASYAPHPSGPEWYLRFRDWLLRGPPALTQ